MSEREILFATKRLIVTRLHMDDIDRLLPILANPQTMISYGDGIPMDRGDIATLIASYPADDPNLLAQPGVVWLTESNIVVGFGGVGYYRAPGNTADVLVVIDPRFHSQGFGTELVRGAIASAFATAGIDIIHAIVRPNNAGSIRMLEKAGMVRFGVASSRNRLAYRIRREEHA